MNIRAFTLFCISLLLTGMVYGQSFPSLDSIDLPQATFSGDRSFSETSLYGYIDGGAELFFEYGFDTLVVTELTARSREIKVEVYRMRDPEAAFGIFSVSRFRCNGGAKLTDHYCRSAYQLQVCKGPYYISIINSDGTREEQALSDEIARLLLADIDEPSFNADQFFPDGANEEMMKSAVLVRGSMGIFNGVPSLSEIIGGAAGYTALILKEENKTVISIRFDSETAAGLFMKKQQIDRDVLDKGGVSKMISGATASKICMQHLLIRAD
jgi:hypothetical protein